MSNLPYDVEIEYIESTGTQYIDTLYKPNQDTRIIAIMRCVVSTNYGVLFGCGTYNSLNSVMIDYETGITGTLHIKYGNNSSWTNVSSIHGDYEIHTYDFNKNNFYLDNELVSSNTYSTFQSTSNLGIFTNIKGNGTGSSSNFFIGKLYSFKIYDNNVLVRDYIPVRVGQVGYLYDKVSDQLFGNSGTSSFTLGKDKILPNFFGFRRRLMAAGWGNEYIIFEDPAVEALCVANWSSDGIGLTYRDALSVTSIGSVFNRNSTITKFNEFRYFTGVTSLPTASFQYCTNLTEITFPNSITSFENHSCSYSGFTSIVIPDNTVIVKQHAFYSSKNLTSLTIGKNCTVGQAFNSCAKLASITFRGGIFSLNDIANYTTATSAELYCHVEDNPDYIEIDGNIYNSSITKLYTIGRKNNVQVPSTVTTISNKMWGSNVANIDLGNVQIMEDRIFLAATWLTHIELPATLTSIGVNCFYGRTNLQYIICRAIVPPTAGSNVFYNVNKPIYVPDESVDAYKAANVWKNYAQYIKPLSEFSN